MRIKEILIIAAAFLPLMLSALTLDEAIELAIENNHDLQQERDEIEVYDQKYYAARGMLLPQLKLVGEYKLQRTELPESAISEFISVSSLLEDQPDGMSAADGVIWENQQVISGYLDSAIYSMYPESTMEEGSFAGGLQFDQVVFSGGKLLSGINIADRVRNMQKDKYQLAKQDVIYHTIEKYYQVKLAEEVVDIQNSALIVAGEHLEDVEKMYEEGLVSEYDKLRAELEYNRLEPELLQAEHNLELAKMSFCDHLGCDSYNELETELEVPDMEIPDKDKAERIGMQNRIEVHLSELNIRIQEVLVKMEKADFYPQVGLNASLSFYTAADEYAIEGDDFGSAASIGLGFQLPLFTGLTRISEIREAKVKVSQAEAADASLQDLIKLDIRNAIQKLEHSKRNLEVQKNNIDLAERGYEIAKARYDNSLGTELEITDAQLMLKQAKISYSKAVYDLILAERYFQKSLGKEL